MSSQGSFMVKAKVYQSERGSVFMKGAQEGSFSGSDGGGKAELEESTMEMQKGMVYQQSAQQL